MKSNTQPYCRWCGKPLRKDTEWHYRGADRANKANRLHSKADCQRQVNQKVISVKYHQDYDDWRGPSHGEPVGERYVYSFSTWDGESYEAADYTGFFCSNLCAFRLGVSAARDHHLASPDYNERIKAINAKKNDAA